MSLRSARTPAQGSEDLGCAPSPGFWAPRPVFSSVSRVVRPDVPRLKLGREFGATKEVRVQMLGNCVGTAAAQAEGEAVDRARGRTLRSGAQGRGSSECELLQDRRAPAGQGLGECQGGAMPLRDGPRPALALAHHQPCWEGACSRKPFGPQFCTPWIFPMELCVLPLSSPRVHQSASRSRESVQETHRNGWGSHADGRPVCGQLLGLPGHPEPLLYPRQVLTCSPLARGPVCLGISYPTCQRCSFQTSLHPLLPPPPRPRPDLTPHTQQPGPVTHRGLRSYSHKPSLMAKSRDVHTEAGGAPL